MSHILTMELSEEAFSALRRAAESQGTTPDALAVDCIQRFLIARAPRDSSPGNGAPGNIADATPAVTDPLFEVEEILRELETVRRKDDMTDAQKEKARWAFRRMFGCIHLGEKSGADNEQIDRDLAAEYGNTHEDA